MGVTSHQAESLCGCVWREEYLRLPSGYMAVATRVLGNTRGGVGESSRQPLRERLAVEILVNQGVRTPYLYVLYRMSCVYLFGGVSTILISVIWRA